MDVEWVADASAPILAEAARVRDPGNIPDSAGNLIGLVWSQPMASVAVKPLRRYPSASERALCGLEGPMTGT